MNKERQHRRTWSEQEDETLKYAVQMYFKDEKPKWKQIASYLVAQLHPQFPRNPKQCRERWYNALSPNLKTTKAWGIDEDIKLIRACKQHGHRWSKLVPLFGNAINDNRLKNHFYSNIRKIVRHLNGFVKDQKKKFVKMKKEGELVDEQYEEIMKQINKLRNFQIKLFSKVFSLVDSRQQYKYQAKESMTVEEIKALNDEILDYIEDQVSGKKQFSGSRVLKMITKMMLVNRSIKTKYNREIKMSLQNQQELIKASQYKKKRQRQLDNLVKQKLDNKIIPDKKTKEQILLEMSNDQRVRRILKPRPKPNTNSYVRNTKTSTEEESDFKAEEKLGRVQDSHGRKISQANLLNNSVSLNKKDKQPEDLIVSVMNYSEANNDNIQTHGDAPNKNGDGLINPFQSNFLNHIPVFTANDDGDGAKKAEPFMSLEHREQNNPFQLPSYKLAQSQGFFQFNLPQNEKRNGADNAQYESELFRSHPLMNSSLFLNNAQHHDEETSSFRAVMNKRHQQKGKNGAQAMGVSANYDQKASSHSSKRNPFQGLSDFPNLHASAFYPINPFMGETIVGQQDDQQSLQYENNGLDASRQLSANLNEIPLKNQMMMDSQMLSFDFYRSTDYQPQQQHPGIGLMRSCSYQRKGQGLNSRKQHS